METKLKITNQRLTKVVETVEKGTAFSNEMKQTKDAIMNEAKAQLS